MVVRNEKLSFIMNMSLSGDEVKNYSHILFDKPIGPSQFKFEGGLLDITEY